MHDDIEQSADKLRAFDVTAQLEEVPAFAMTQGRVSDAAQREEVFQYFAEEYQRPVVIAGFEPLDVMQAIRMLVQQLNDGRACVENQFTRGVTRDGNGKAQRLVAEVLELRPRFEWRGLGELPYSGLRIKSSFGEFDAERRFDMKVRPVAENAACQCAAIIRGVKKPTDCAIFGTACTPRNPIGSCMVSAEGACAAYYKYRRGAVQAAG